MQSHFSAVVMMLNASLDR